MYICIYVYVCICVCMCVLNAAFIDCWDLLTIHTLIILYIMSCFSWLCGVHFHHIIIHESRSSEQWETAGTTQYTPQHMFCCLLHPMTQCILKPLVPHQWTWTYAVGNIPLIIDYPHIQESILFGFPGDRNDAIAINYCILYAKHFIYRQIKQAKYAHNWLFVIPVQS